MKYVPRATYRLQFNAGFTFQHAEAILDYLADLGISDVYASPLFEAGPESTHGYDICSFGKINPRLGSSEDFDNLVESLKQRKLGLVVDIVPNHMSATTSNAWWRDVLENGRASPFAEYFDVDWDPPDNALRDKILLPVLEDSYQKVSENKKLRLIFQNGKFSVAYYERNFPVDTQTLPASATQQPAVVLKDFNGSNGHQPSRNRLDELIHRQHYRLDSWRTASEKLNYRRFFDVTEMVAVRMELPEVFHATHKLVFEWLDAGKITGLRIDHPDGLWDPKQYLDRLRERGSSAYIVVEKILSGDESLPRDWPVEGTTGYDFLNGVNGLFVDGANTARFDEIYKDFTGNSSEFGELVYQSRKLVLKLSFGSELKALTARLGTLASKICDTREFPSLELQSALGEVIASFPVYRTYINKSSDGVSPQDAIVIRKAVNDAEQRAGPQIDPAIFDFIKKILLLEYAGERVLEFVMKFQQLTGPAMAKGMEDTAFYRFNRLISLNEVGGQPGRFGVTLDEFHQANSEAAKTWPHTMLASATHDTKRGEDLRARLNVLSEMPNEWRDTIKRWSQINADKKTLVVNKPAPDANDEYLLYQTLVGAWPMENPARWIESVPDDQPKKVTQRLPLSGGEGRGEGEGAPLSPKVNESQERRTVGDKVPERDFTDRITAFMLKAVKEAKLNTSWTEPSEAYEQALKQFIANLLEQPSSGAFLKYLRNFAQRIAFFGRINSLSQTLLKLASPGVPDCYQGSELWDLNLVDPDNRRPVDFTLRRRMLADLKARFEDHPDGTSESIAELLSDHEPGAMKLFLLWRVLNFRKQHRDLFDFGDYLPLAAAGNKESHICAFTRQWKQQAVIAVAPRLVFGLTGGAEQQPLGEVWKDTELLLPPSFAGSPLRNIITGEEIITVENGAHTRLDMTRVFKLFPVALFERA